MKLRPDHYAAARARRAAQADRNLKRFAEMMAEGWTIAAAARALGLAESAGTRYMKRLRDDLGWQAQ